MKAFSTSFSLSNQGLVYDLIDSQSCFILSKKYLVGTMYFSSQLSEKNVALSLLRYTGKVTHISILLLLFCCNINQAITNFRQKSWAGLITLTFLPSYILTWFRSRICVTKLLATCQDGFRCRKSLTYVYRLPMIEVWMGDQDSLNYLCSITFSLGSGSSSSMRSLIFLQICFSMSSVRLNQWQQLSNLLSVDSSRFTYQLNFLFLRPNTLPIFYVTTIRGRNVFQRLLVTDLMKVLEENISDFFSRFQHWNISCQIQLAVMKKPRQTALSEVAAGCGQGEVVLIASSCCIFSLNSARQVALNVVCFVFECEWEFTGGWWLSHNSISVMKTYRLVQWGLQRQLASFFHYLPSSVLTFSRKMEN